MQHQAKFYKSCRQLSTIGPDQFVHVHLDAGRKGYLHAMGRSNLGEVSMRATIVTSHPDPPPIPPKQKRIRNEEHCQTPQQRARPPNPKIMKHSHREQRKPRSKQWAQKIIACQHWCHISRICMSKVTEYGIEDQTRAHAKEARANDGTIQCMLSKLPVQPN